MTPSETVTKLPSPAPQANGQRAVGIRWDATAIRSSAPPVRSASCWVRPHAPAPINGGHGHGVDEASSGQ